jgi:hypothetical protein
MHAAMFHVAAAPLPLQRTLARDGAPLCADASSVPAGGGYMAARFAVPFQIAQRASADGPASGR